MKVLLIVWLFIVSFTACGQSKDTDAGKKSITKTEQHMDVSKISNEKVKGAIEALQANDKKAWYSYFTTDVVFTDDGRTLDFTSFFDNAFDKKEKFLTLDRIENDGKDLYGNFYAGQWGTFRVYFKFYQNAEGKFNRLAIGQTMQ